MLTAAYLRERLDYDPATGVFTWRPIPEHTRHDRTWNGKYAGRIAGSIERCGYVVIGLCGKVHKAHRLAWLYVHGEWPAKFLDHKDQDKTHNWIDNLREATKSQNGANKPAPVVNTSGHKGVSRDRGLWRAKIRVNGKDVYLGSYHDERVAAAAYARAAVAYFGEFAAV